MIAQADGKLRQGVNAAAVPALAPEQAGNARKLQRAAGAERVLVGAALRCRHHAVMGRAGDDFAQANDAFLGTLGDIGVGRQGGERGQALEVDREIGCGVELRHFPGLEMIEPGAHTGGADGALLGALAAGADEGSSGKQMSGEIGGGVEQQRVVLGEIPLHVVARLVHPVAEIEDRLVDAGYASFSPMSVPQTVRDQISGTSEKVGAVVAILDRGQDFLDHRVGVGAGAAACQPGEGANRVAFGKFRDFVERFGDAVGKRGRCRTLAAGMADLDAERAGGDEAVGIQRDAEMAEIGGCLLRRADDQTRFAAFSTKS